MIDVTELVRKMLAPVARRVGSMIVRSVVESIDDSGGMQAGQFSLQAGVTRDTVERFQQFGFTSVPAANAEAVVVAIGGDSDHLIAIIVDDRNYRPTGLSEGESAQYTKQNGLRVYCKSDGTVNLGTSPSDFVSLSQKVLTELTNIQSNINTNLTALSVNLASIALILNTAGPVVGAPGAVSPFVETSCPAPNSVAAAEVKAK